MLKGETTDDSIVRRVSAAEIQALVVVQVRALMQQPELVFGTWMAARTEMPDLTEAEVQASLSGSSRCGTNCSRRSGRGSCGGWSSELWWGRTGRTSASGSRGWPAWFGTSGARRQRRERGGAYHGAGAARDPAPDRDARRWCRRPARRTARMVRTRADPALLKALARAFRWQRLLDEGRYGSISELALAEHLERGYLGRVLSYVVAAGVVEAIINGRQGEGRDLPELMGVCRTSGVTADDGPNWTFGIWPAAAGSLRRG